MQRSITIPIVCIAAFIASGSAFAGTYLNQCLRPHQDPATGKTLCPKPLTNTKPTKCCKITADGNIDLSDCGGVVSTESGYWCVKGNDYVGVYCKAAPDGNSEICEDRRPPHTIQYAAECDHWVPLPGGGRVCADGEPGLPSGIYCCGNIENGKVDESSCGRAGTSTDRSTGTTTLTCTSGTLLACEPESGILTWCSPI